MGYEEPIQRLNYDALRSSDLAIDKHISPINLSNHRLGRAKIKKRLGSKPNNIEKFQRIESTLLVEHLEASREDSSDCGTHWKI